jgi:D-sedoheptulose 7-phosphate isomerase
MDLIRRVKAHFEEGVELRRKLADTLPAQIAPAGVALARAVEAGNKILSCGNGGSAADSQHFAAEMVGRFERERPGIAAFALTVDTSALTAIANDWHYDQVFARQIAAVGRPGDVLVAISTSGNSKNVMEAINAAHARKMSVIALTGRDGGGMAKLLEAGDFHLNVPHPRTMRVQEIHILVLHCLCDLVDDVLYGESGG